MTYRFDETQELLLLAIYEFYSLTDSDRPMTAEDMVGLITDEVSPMFAIQAIETLVERKLLGFRERSFPQTYEITGRGIAYVEGEIDNPSTFLSRHLARREHGEVGSRSRLSPANREDDQWQPLRIDRTSHEYSEATGVLERAVSVIESDNGYAANEPEERDQIVWSLKEGLKAIQEKLPSRAQMIALVVQPLKFMAKKFAETAMGEAAKAAIPKLIAWLASL